MASETDWLTKYPEAKQESWLDKYPEATEKPFFDLSDTLSATGRAFTSLGTSVPASMRQAFGGLENPWQRSEGYAQSRADMQALQQELEASDAAAMAGGDASSVSSSIREATPSLGFSGSTLVPSLAAGAVTALATKSPLAARSAAAGTSLLMAYRMAGAQFLDDSRERIDNFFQEKLQRPLTPEEQNEAYEELLPLARKFGAAEAGPEALGNMALGGAGKYIRKALGGKNGIMSLASNALSKVTGAKAVGAGVGAAAGEVGTEAITAVEQDRINKEFEQSVLRGEAPESVVLPDRTVQDYTQGITNVAPTTLAMTGLTGLAGLGPTAINRGYRALRPQAEQQVVETEIVPEEPAISPGLTAAVNTADSIVTTAENTSSDVSQATTAARNIIQGVVNTPQPQVAPAIELPAVTPSPAMEMPEKTSQTITDSNGEIAPEMSVLPPTVQAGAGAGEAIQPQPIETAPDAIIQREIPENRVEERLQIDEGGPSAAPSSGNRFIEGGQIQEEVAPPITPQGTPTPATETLGVTAPPAPEVDTSETPPRAVNAPLDPADKQIDAPIAAKNGYVVFERPDGKRYKLRDNSKTPPEWQNAEGKKVMLKGFGTRIGNSFLLQPQSKNSDYNEKAPVGDTVYHLYEEDSGRGLGNMSATELFQTGWTFVEEVKPAEAPPITPKGEAPTPATEGTVMPGGSAIERDVEFSVDEQLLMHSPFTNEDSSVSFRGVMPDGDAVVWSGKTQMKVPSAWLRRAGEPLPISANKVGDVPISVIDQESQPDSSVTVTTDRQQTLPIPKTKDGLIAEMVGPIKTDYVARQAQQKLINNYKKFSKDELLDMVKDQRARDAEFKRRQEATLAIIEQIKEPVNNAGTGWVRSIKDIAKSNGIDDYSILQGNSRGEEIYRIAARIADRGNAFVNPFQESPQTTTVAAPTETAAPSAKEAAVASVVQQPVEGSIPTVEQESAITAIESTEKTDIANAAMSFLEEDLTAQQRKVWTPEMFTAAQAFFDSGGKDFDSLKKAIKFPRVVQQAYLKADKEAAAEQTRREAADAAMAREVEKATKEQAKLEADQKQREELGLKTLNSLIEKTRTNVVQGTVKSSDANQAVAILNKSGAIPNVLFTWIGTSKDFLADPANRARYPETWKAVSSNPNIEGMSENGQPIVFTDNVGVSDLDRNLAKLQGTTPEIAAVRRVILHENIHKGMFFLSLKDKMKLFQFLHRLYSPEELDQLAKSYDEYSDWRINQVSYFSIIEEAMTRDFDSMAEIPRDGIWAEFMQFLRDIWQKITGKTSEPTLKNYKDVFRLIRNSLKNSEAANADRLKNGGGVRMSMSEFISNVTPEQDAAYAKAVADGDMETAQRMVDEAAEKAGLPILNENEVTAYKVRRKPAPKKTEKAYKLFRVKKGSQGEVFALFVGANDPLPQGIWLDATEGPRAEDSKTGKAKVKSKLGPLAYRPGWHAGDVPLATHIGASDIKGGPIVGRKFDEVWAEVEMASDVDYQPEANANGVTKDGSISVALADIKKMPEDGLYRYKTNPNMTGQWIISGSMKINRILSENEVNSILEKASLQTMPWMEKPQGSKTWSKTPLNLEQFGLGTNPAANQKKLLDTVTYDDAGNVIPLSRRFQSASNDIRFSKVTYDSPNEAAFNSGAEVARNADYDERDKAVRSTIRAAYDLAPKNNGPSVPLDQLFDIAKQSMPDLTENEFSQILQDLYEDSGALLQAGESPFIVTTPDGQRAGSVIVMPLSGLQTRAMASIVDSPATNEFTQSVDDINNGTAKAAFSGRQFKDFKPIDRTVKSAEEYSDVAIKYVNNIEKEGVSLEDIANSVISPAFLESIGIEQDLMAQDALTIEVRQRVDNASRKEKSPGRKKQLSKLSERLSAFWQGVGSKKGQHLGQRRYLVNKARYSWMFIRELAEKAMKEARTNILISNFGSENATSFTQNSYADSDKANQQSVDENINAAEESQEFDQDAADLAAGEATLTSTFLKLYEELKDLLREQGILSRLNAQENITAKASITPARRNELAALSKDERAKLSEKNLKRIGEILNTLLGKEADANTQEKKTVRKKREKMVEVAKKRADKGQPIDPAETANDIAIRLLNEFENKLAQSAFFNSATKPDTIVKAFREQISDPMDRKAFKDRLMAMEVTSEMADRLFDKAARTKDNAQWKRAQDMLEGPNALRNILREINRARPGDQAPLSKQIPWRELLSQNAKTVEEYRQRIFDAISANEELKSATPEQKARLADLFAEAWEANRTRILDGMLERMIRSEEAKKNLSKEGAKALQEQRMRIVEDINLGIFDNDELAKRMAEKFGVKSEFTEMEREKINSLIEVLQDEGLNAVKRQVAAYKLLEVLQGELKIPVAKMLADFWVSSVLSGPNTIVSIGLAVASGAFELSTALSRVFIAGFTNQKQLPSELAGAYKTLARLLSAFGRQANIAWQYLVTGDPAFLDPSMNDVTENMQWGNIGKSNKLAEQMAKSDKILVKSAGLFMRTVSRLLTALDVFNSGLTKEGSLSIVFRHIGLDPEKIAALEKKSDLKPYKDAIIQKDFGGTPPKSARDKAIVDSYALSDMMAELDKLGNVSENANFFGQQGAMTLDPSGLGGVGYRAIRSLVTNFESGSDRFLKKAQRGWSDSAQNGDQILSGLELAFAYALQFLAYNAANFGGVRFARFAGNKFNQGLSFIPGIGFARAFEAEFDPDRIKAKEAFIDSIQRNQLVGVMLSIGGYYILKAIADEPDDEKRGWFINGGWGNLTPEKKQQKLAAGEKEYTIGINGKVFNYANWPISSALAAIGSLSDLIRFSPDQWKDKNVTQIMASAAMSGAAAAADIPALSQFQELFGNSLSSKDPNEKRMERFAKVMSSYAGGFVPRFLKDIDYAQDPNLRKYETLWEKTASHIPVYRRYEGKEYYDILGQQIQRNIYPGSREFMTKPTDPAYKVLGALNSRGIWLTPANAEHRMVGKGARRRSLTQEEADNYSLETGKGYKQMLLRYGQRALQMPTERAKAFLLDKADDVRDRALKKVYRGYTPAS